MASSRKPVEPLTAGTVVAPIRRSPPPVATGRSRVVSAQFFLATVTVVVYNVFQFCGSPAHLAGQTWPSTLLGSGGAAVTWLFVLLGFGLYAPLSESLSDVAHRPATADSRGRVTRGLLQLLPVYYLAVVTVWFTRQQHLPGDWRDLLEHLSFTQVFDAKRIFYTNGPGWAVSVAVIFCLVLTVMGPVLRGARRRFGEPRAGVATAAFPILCILVALVWKAAAYGWLGRSPGGSYPTWFGPLNNLDALGAGLLVAVVTAPRLTPAPTSAAWTARKRFVPMLLGVVVVVLACLQRSAGGWFEVYFGSASAVGFALVLTACLLRGEPGPVDVTSSRGRPGWQLGSLAVLGWGLYVWHEPVMLALAGHLGVTAHVPSLGWDIVVVLGASLAVSWLTHRMIERPVRQLLGG